MPKRIIRDPRQDLLYMGGPVDYAEHDAGTSWHHWADWKGLGDFDVYCPRCRCAGLEDWEIIEQNQRALRMARLAILDLRTHSIGTPIEMFWRLWEQQKSAILIAKPGSVFIRYTERHYPAFVVPDPMGALVQATRLLVPGSWKSLDTGIESINVRGDDKQRDT